MDADEKNKIRTKLADEIKETRTKVSKYLELSQPISPENAIGRISRMDAINNKSVLEAALREAQSKLIQLKKIIKKIESSDFGLCKICKKNIPFGRLMIRPESELCVNCAK
jgi:DnaK suppressor protein